MTESIKEAIIENRVLPKYMLLWGGSFLDLVTDPVPEDAEQSCKLLNTLNTHFQSTKNIQNTVISWTISEWEVTGSEESVSGHHIYYYKTSKK